MSERVKIERSGDKNISRRAKGRDYPDFDSMFDADDNPLEGIEYSGDIQASADREMSAVELEIERNRAASAERFRIGTDEGYYFVVCFQTEEQKKEFLQKVGWLDDGDKYLNGLEIAEKLGIELEIIPIEPRKLRVNPKKFFGKEVMSHAR